MNDWQPIDASLGVRSTISVADIIVDPKFQMREAGTDPEVADRYARIMERSGPDGWSVFPPIKLIKIQSRTSRLLSDYYVYSGFHRLAAMKLNGYDEIECIVTPGTHRDGLVLAAGENADRSQPRTYKDIEKTVEMFLRHPEFRLWTNAQIARWCAVDPQTVTNHERRLMSNPKFEFEPRTDKLKFIDKHGNVSYRKNPNTLKSLEARAEDTQAEAEPLAVDPDELSRRQLLHESVDLHIKEVAPYVEFRMPEETEARRQELIKSYPVYEKYEHRESLSLDDLQHLKDTLQKMGENLSAKKNALWRMVNDIQWDIRRTFTDCDYKYRKLRDEAIAADYPEYVKLDSTYNMPYHELESLKSVLEEIKQKIDTDGDTEFLPEEYFAQQEKLKAARKDKASMKVLVDRAHDAGEAGESAFKAMIRSEKAFAPIMGDDDLWHWIESDYLPKFITAYNRRADKANRVPPKGRDASRWNLENKETDILEQTERGWKGIKQACEDRPEWVDTFIFDTCCAISTIEFLTRGFGFQTIENFTLEPETPLTTGERRAIVKAAYLAAENAYYALGRKKNLPTFKTVKRAAG